LNAWTVPSDLMSEHHHVDETRTKSLQWNKIMKRASFVLAQAKLHTPPHPVKHEA